MSWLAWPWCDLAAAEAALAQALEKALRLWPRDGVPREPQAWLLSVARRQLLVAARHQRLHHSPEVQAVLAGSSDLAAAGAWPDSRLKLLFVCAHPAIDPALRPALMLQVVLGLKAEQVAQAMLTSPTAMAPRRVRAKQKIRDAGQRFEEPGPDEWPERLHAVLEAIYAAYGLGWAAAEAQAEPAGVDDAVLQGLRAEALGLLALMLHSDARRAARRGADGRFVPLAEHDTRQWSAPQVAFAAACAQAGDPARAWALLAALSHPRLSGYQPDWVTRAHAPREPHRKQLAGPGCAAATAADWPCARRAPASDGCPRVDSRNAPLIDPELTWRKPARLMLLQLPAGRLNWGAIASSLTTISE